MRLFWDTHPRGDERPRLCLPNDTNIALNAENVSLRMRPTVHTALHEITCGKIPQIVRISTQPGVRKVVNPSFCSEVRRRGADGVLSEGLMAPNRINYLTHAPPPSLACLCQTSSASQPDTTNAPFGKTVLLQSERLREEERGERRGDVPYDIPSENGINPFNSAFECLQVMARGFDAPLVLRLPASFFFGRSREDIWHLQNFVCLHNFESNTSRYRNTEDGSSGTSLT